VRRAAWIAAGVIFTLGALAVVAIFSLRDRSTPSTVSFEGTVGSGPGDPGIYRYDTAGFEQVDALVGARHDYPVVTAVVIEDGACGPVMRWEPLAQRSDEWSFCGPDGSVSRIVEFHEWFGMGDTADGVCEGLRLESAGDGEWQAACTREGTDIAIVVEMLGMESRSVGADEVTTVHIRMTETTSGQTEGTRVTDLWMVPGTPLYVRKQVADRSTSASPIGEVTYVEEYTLELKSLIPVG